MKPAPFELETAHTVDDVLTLLADTDREVKMLAGGQSLVPLLNFRLARPTVLVDLTGCPRCSTSTNARTAWPSAP